MVVGRITSRIARTVVTRYQSSSILHGRPDNRSTIPIIGNHFPGSQNKVIAGQTSLLHNSVLSSSAFQRFGFSSSASTQPNEKGTSENGKENTNDEKEGSDDLTMEDMIGLVTEKEELLKTKQEEIKILEDKLLRSYADMENVMARTKREAENSKKFAIQNFAKSLLDVADNLDRASSVVKESFAKLDTSGDTATATAGGAVPLLKTLLEGVEMTEKQLAEVFKKFGVEKYDPTNEEFDPNRHNAVFQVPDPTKSPDTVAVVLKAGYTLHERIIRPAEVGVTIKVD